MNNERSSNKIDEMYKNIFKSIGISILSNIVLFIVHIWVYFGAIFNDTGYKANTLIGFLKMGKLYLGILPLIICYILVYIYLKRKHKINSFIYIFIQLIIVVLYFILYMNTYYKSL